MGAKGNTIAALLGLAFVWPFAMNLIAARNGMHASGGFIDVIIFICLVYRWYSLDRVEREYKTSGLLNIAVMLIAIVGLPIYLVQSRGWRDGLTATFIAFIILVASVALTISGEVAARAIVA